jgi:hypothetical protein
MNKTKIIVPRGIRYINEWTNFHLPDFPSIIDKQITGCGFTEFCLTNEDNVILVSPRKILLENKEEQHKGDVFYATTGLEKQVDFEKDLTKSNRKLSKKDLEQESERRKEEISLAIQKLKSDVWDYWLRCTLNNTPCKILVTYDSFRHVKEVLSCALSSFQIVVDEFQSIFVDSKFKSSTEIEFLHHIQDIKKLTFVSATPMIDKYLDMLDEFKDLPFYELDWESEEPTRVLRPKLIVHSCSRSIIPAANKIIQSYLNKEFETTLINIDGELKEVVSQEAVLYVNSVKNICDIIKGNNLTIENTNVLCSKTSDNEDKVRAAFGLKKQDLKSKGVKSVIGSIPTRGEKHKMFTLCTRTVYLGADFYSTNARTFIFSDANVDSLTVDITLDLPQILGRQRLDENPWKNRADLYYKTINKDNKITRQESDEIIEKKKKKTENLLSVYSSAPEEARHDLAETYQYVAKAANYKNDYVAVNEHSGKDLVPVFNNLMMVSDMRCYEIQQIDYANRFRVFNSLNDSVKDEDFSKLVQIIHHIEGWKANFTDKMKYLYSLDLDPESIRLILDNLADPSFAKYYYSIPKERAGTLGYQKGNLEKEYNNIKSYNSNSESIVEEIKTRFIIGEKYSKSDIKEILRLIYESNGYSKTPKASELMNYFELKECLIPNKITGKRDRGFEILGLKENE